jgi:hypothetical protein
MMPRFEGAFDHDQAAEFRAWLKETGLPDTAETRRRDVALRAVKHGHNVA